MSILPVRFGEGPEIIPHSFSSRNATMYPLAVTPRWLRRAPAGLLAALVLAACSDDPSGPDAPDAQVGMARRLLVGDAAEGGVRVVEVESGQVIATLATRSPVTYLPVDKTGRYAFAVQRTGDVVQIIDGGITRAEGSRSMTRQAPALLAMSLPGGLPTHGDVHGDWFATFLDGTGEVKLVDGRTLGSAAPTTVTVATGRAHHGAMMVMSDVVLTSTPDFAGGPTSILPTGLDVRSIATGQVVQSFATACPGLHGEAATPNATAWGCTDGILIVRRSGTQWTAQKVPYTGEFAGAGIRSGTLFGHESAPYFVAHMGGGKPPARVDVATGALTPIVLPGRPPLATGYVFTEDGRSLLALSPAGDLHVLNASTLSLRGTVAGVGVALADPVPSTASNSFLTAGSRYAYVGNPAKGEVAEVNLETLAVTRRFAVGGAPQRVTLLGGE